LPHALVLRKFFSPRYDYGYPTTIADVAIACRYLTGGCRNLVLVSEAFNLMVDSWQNAVRNIVELPGSMEIVNAYLFGANKLDNFTSNLLHKGVDCNRRHTAIKYFESVNKVLEKVLTLVYSNFPDYQQSGLDIGRWFEDVGQRSAVFDIANRGFPTWMNESLMSLILTFVDISTLRHDIFDDHLYFIHTIYGLSTAYVSSILNFNIFQGDLVIEEHIPNEDSSLEYDIRRTRVNNADINMLRSDFLAAWWNGVRSRLAVSTPTDI